MTFLAEALMSDLPDEPCFLSELVRRPAWMAQGVCRQHPGVNFFVARGESNAEAKALCQRCPVQQECLAHALAHGERHGVWGGHSERERQRLRRARKAA